MSSRIDIPGQAAAPPARSFQEIAREIKPLLSEKIFAKNRARLVWLPVHLAIAGAAIFTVITLQPAWPGRIGLALVIGHSYACLMFLSHEICHGTIVKSPRLQWGLATLCMLPLCIGPGQWKAWHNRFHHGRTNRSGEDPDTRVGVEVYRRHRVARVMTAFNPGSRRLASYFFPFVWFSAQSAIVLFHHSKVCHYWPPRRRRRQLLQFWSMVSLWVVVAFAVGPFDWLTIHLAPLLVANAILMSYVATNHLLCDATESANDPLANSLSVKVPRFVDWLHLNFSYHVEHHVFPYVNPKHMPAVHHALRDRFGARARRMPIGRALALAYRTPPIHLGERELVDLQLGRVVSTLGPSGEPPEELGEVPLPVTPGSGFKFSRRRAKRPGSARRSRRRESRAEDNS